MSAGEVQAGKQTNQGYRYNGSSLSSASSGAVLKPPKQNGKNISISGTLTAIAAGIPKTLTNAQANKLEAAGKTVNGNPSSPPNNSNNRFQGGGGSVSSKNDKTKTINKNVTKADKSAIALEKANLGSTVRATQKSQEQNKQNYYNKLDYIRSIGQAQLNEADRVRAYDSDIAKLKLQNATANNLNKLGNGAYGSGLQLAKDLTFKTSDVNNANIANSYLANKNSILQDVAANQTEADYSYATATMQNQQNLSAAIADATTNIANLKGSTTTNTNTSKTYDKGDKGYKKLAGYKTAKSKGKTKKVRDKTYDSITQNSTVTQASTNLPSWVRSNGTINYAKELKGLGLDKYGITKKQLKNGTYGLGSGIAKPRTLQQQQSAVPTSERVALNIKRYGG